jgi:hypothetical protein
MAKGKRKNKRKNVFKKRHKICKSDESYKGEWHPLQVDVHGCIRRANFLGPGTHLLERIKRGDRPVNNIDKAAFRHDIMYSLYPDNTKDADAVFINDIKNIKGLSATVSVLAIKLKLLAQRLGLLPSNIFASGPRLSDADELLLRDALHKLNDGQTQKMQEKTDHKKTDHEEKETENVQGQRHE